ncbi:two-component system response regulator [Rhizobium sp. Leaf384]|nr:two-component system response regulator [Rhizobium sp. Leaf384]KQS85566.1 two-component system response regulator [Rhizobium sp. Leaf383]
MISASPAHTGQAISIAVVDDHPLFREGVSRSLNEIGGFRIVGEGSSSADAVRLSRECAPDVMLLDISLPGGGLEAIEPILEDCPTRILIMLTVSESADDLKTAIQRGAKGYVLKGVGSRTLADIIRTVHSGESYIAPALSFKLVADMTEAHAKPADQDVLAGLTAREQDVLKLVASGLSNKMVARDLNLHEKTIKHHMTRIFVKLNVKNRTEAALAMRDANQPR